MESRVEWPEELAPRAGEQVVQSARTSDNWVSQGRLFLTTRRLVWWNKSRLAPEEFDKPEVAALRVTRVPTSLEAWAVIVLGAALIVLGAVIFYDIYAKYATPPLWPEFGKCFNWLYSGGFVVVGIVLEALAFRRHLNVKLKIGKTFDFYVAAPEDWAGAWR